MQSTRPASLSVPAAGPSWWPRYDPSTSRHAGWRARHTWILAALLAALAVFYMLTLRAGHQAGDFAAMLQHAVNLVEGRPYATTTYHQNPDDVGVGGLNVYPPGLPVLMAPVYALFGFDFTAMKGAIVLLFVGAVALLARAARHALPPPYVFLLVGFVGLQPYFWEIKDDVLSDLPFLFFTLLGLVLIETTARAGPGRARWAWSAATGFVIFAATQMRSVGLALVISLLLYDLIRHRRWLPTSLFWAPALVFVAGMVLQNVFLPLDSNATYTRAILSDLTRPGDAAMRAAVWAHRYVHGCFLNTLLANDYSSAFRYLLGLPVLGMIGIGFLWRVFRQLTVFEVFTAVFTGIMLVWPYQMIRYMIPVYVLMFFYLTVGLVLARRRLPAPYGRALVVVLVAGIGLTYALRYSTRNFDVVPQDVVLEPSQEMYRFVREQTPEDAVFVSRVPNVIALFTNRTATVPLDPADERFEYTEAEAEAVLAYLDEIDADYVVTGPLGPYYHAEVEALWKLVRAYPERFERVFENEELEVYRVRETVE